MAPAPRAWPTLALVGLLAIAPAPSTPPAAAADTAPEKEAVTAVTASDVAEAAPAPVDFEALLGPITRDRLFRVCQVGLQVTDVTTGQPVFSHRAEHGLVPASTTKVLTAAVALRTLGPAHRFTTDVFATGEVDAAGVLDGDLYVQGHGDPTLVVEKLWKLVYDLKVEGIREIRGDVVFDEGYFDTEYQLPGWTKPRDLREGPSYFATSSALSLNFNTVALVVAPGTEVGQAARVGLETPASRYVTVENEVLTGPVGSRRRLDIDREATEGGMTFTVTGVVPADDTVKKYYRTVADPTAHFMAAWQDLEETHGIAVKGRHRRGSVPAAARLLYQHRSVPLTAVLMDMNKYSNNFMAEQVLKTVGAETAGLPGTTAKGLDVARGYLDELGVARDTYTLVNGSGLSRDASLPPDLLTRVMVDMARDPRVGAEFRTSLSIAGWDGTLWARLREDPARVRGKTGTIDGVHGLTGYVTAADGHLYAFSFLVNDLRGGASPARRLHDRFLRRMFNAGAP